MHGFRPYALDTRRRGKNGAPACIDFNRARMTVSAAGAACCRPSCWGRQTRRIQHSRLQRSWLLGSTTNAARVIDHRAQCASTRRTRPTMLTAKYAAPSTPRRIRCAKWAASMRRVCYAKYVASSTLRRVCRAGTSCDECGGSGTAVDVTHWRQSGRLGGPT